MAINTNPTTNTATGVASEHVLLSYYVLATALIMFATYPLLLLLSSTSIPHPLLTPNYSPSHHPQLSPLFARSTAVWFLLSGLMRLGAFVTWGQHDRGFAGWYDACIVSLGVPLWHYGVERAVWGSVSWRQVALAYAIDGLGVGWMLWVRGSVLGGLRF